MAGAAETGQEETSYALLIERAGSSKADDADAVSVRFGHDWQSESRQRNWPRNRRAGDGGLQSPVIHADPSTGAPL